VHSKVYPAGLDLLPAWALAQKVPAFSVPGIALVKA
jgi:hypothetical protein